MKLVKLTTPFPEWPLLRQTPGQKGVWGNCQFVLDHDIEDCDWWVVYDGLLKREEVNCPPENTILITAEPPSIKKYHEDFLAQFSLIVSSHTDINHPNLVNAQQGLPWHIGRHWRNGEEISFTRDYDEIKAVKTFQKERLLSIISSSKDYTEGHRNRLVFIKKLKEYFGDRLDVFGRGIRDVEDKWDAISGYKYHIVMENSSCSHYWSEKLSDAFLAGSFPFYYGCSNIYEYFSQESLVTIDINDIDGSIKVIEKAIQNHVYENSINKIFTARDLVLDKYNIFPVIDELCNSSNVSSKKKTITIRPEISFVKKKSIFSRSVKKAKRFLNLPEKKVG